jgi:hypothetical protein
MRISQLFSRSFLDLALPGMQIFVFDQHPRRIQELALDLAACIRNGLENDRGIQFDLSAGLRRHPLILLPGWLHGVVWELASPDTESEGGFF